uniref:Small ribosomal subunit protein uS2c n=1 Tax=Eutreptiella pomquetensis TaxID=215699 RepID=A0A223FM13_9EUGL|nr:ribosomal protein S2 [Eutreptiella pomquetensis]
MITVKQMVDSGVHLGHQVRRWNPKMASYIYGERNGIHIIDILQTLICLSDTTDYLVKAGKENKTILFVGTKRQFASIIESCAEKSNSHYVNQRWLGGMLTNWSTMKVCIENLQILNQQEEDGTLSRLTKKEAAILNKRKDKLEKYFGGVKEMGSLPDVVILVGQPRELIAVKECIKLGIKTITITDTNCDPTLTDFAIPGNDDSIRSVELILNELTDSIVKGQNTK